MNSLVARLFRFDKPLEAVQYLLLAAMAVTIPHGWNVPIWLFVLLCFNTVAKTVVRGKAGNPVLTRGVRWALVLLMAYYLIIFLSMAYTSNMERGWNFLFRKLTLFLFPLLFLVSDSTFLTRDRLRAVLYAFCLSLTVRFVVMFCHMLTVSHKIVFSSSFDSMHHTYVAMYLLMALGFIYSEWCRCRKGTSPWLYAALLFMALLMVAYTVMVASRTGVAGLLLFAVAVLIHRFFVLKRRWQTLLLAAVVLVAGAAVYSVIPESSRRLTKTVTEINAGDKSDARFYIMGNALKVIGENMPFGVGIGDRDDVLLEKYRNDPDEKFHNSTWNPHNLFLDTTLVVGVPGLLLLLSVLLLPFVIAWRRSDMLWMTFIVVFSFTGLFEAILDRQMGLLFFSLFYVLFCGCSRSGQADSTL